MPEVFTRDCPALSVSLYKIKAFLAHQPELRRLFTKFIGNDNLQCDVFLCVLDPTKPNCCQPTSSQLVYDSKSTGCAESVPNMHGMKPPRSIFLGILYVREPTSLVQLLY
jgi:hypothetical protein